MEAISSPPVEGAVAAYKPELPPAEAPEIVFETAEGEARSLADFRGQLVLINFWATWCGPCKYEMPSLDRLQAQMAGRPFEVIAISSDRQGRSAVEPFFADAGIETLPIYLDPDNSAGRAYGVSRLPTTVLIGPAGKVLGRMVAPAEWDEPEPVALIDYYLKAVEAQQE
ncbi:MAG: TlpA disulfide reductase family protein [Alphaproteobacteria bacterium]|nr:TlpA disulfide reductase family protein [Alphaproteobacteria bacterium]